MDLLPWSLVLLSGVIHSLWNLKVKQVDNRSLFLAVAYFCAGVFMLPLAAGFDGLQLPPGAVLPVMLSAVAESMYVVALAQAYSRYDLSFVYPIARGSGPIWATAAGALFFREQLSALGVLGMAVIICGMLIISFRKEEGSLRALGLSLLIGFFIGSYSSLDRLAIEYTSVYNLLFWKFIIAGIILLALHVRQQSLWENIRASIKLSALAGLFIISAYFLVVLAMKHSNLGYVTVGRESGIAFTCLLSALLLKERIGRVKLLGILVLFLGIVMLRLA
ncbi:MAG: SMR family transporter [Bacillota bacterium]